MNSQCVHSGDPRELRFGVAVQRAGVAGSQGLPARARVMASRAVSPWFAAESRRSRGSSVCGTSARGCGWCAIMPTPQLCRIRTADASGCGQCGRWTRHSGRALQVGEEGEEFVGCLVSARRRSRWREPVGGLLLQRHVGVDIGACADRRGVSFSGVGVVFYGL